MHRSARRGLVAVALGALAQCSQAGNTRAGKTIGGYHVTQMSAEEQDTKVLPAAYACDGCFAAMFSLSRSFMEAESLLQFSRDLRPSETIEVVEKACLEEAFEEIMLGEHEGKKALFGAGTRLTLQEKTSSTFSHSGGEWPSRLSNNCKERLGEHDETRLYEIWLRQREIGTQPSDFNALQKMCAEGKSCGEGQHAHKRSSRKPKKASTKPNKKKKKSKKRRMQEAADVAHDKLLDQQKRKSEMLGSVDFKEQRCDNCFNLLEEASRVLLEVEAEQNNRVLKEFEVLDTVENVLCGGLENDVQKDFCNELLSDIGESTFYATHRRVKHSTGYISEAEKVAIGALCLRVELSGCDHCKQCARKFEKNGGCSAGGFSQDMIPPGCQVCRQVTQHHCKTYQLAPEAYPSGMTQKPKRRREF